MWEQTTQKEKCERFGLEELKKERRKKEEERKRRRRKEGRKEGSV